MRGWRCWRRRENGRENEPENEREMSCGGRRNWGVGCDGGDALMQEMGKRQW